MITIKELAEIAGVSPSTVSNVLHGRTTKMTPETLEKVQQVISETKYVSNMGGRLLGKYGSKIIGVIMTFARRDDIIAMQDPFFSEMIGTLERQIRQNGYFMMLYTSADVEESLRMAFSWDVEGLIVLGSQADDCQKFMQSTDIPLVFIDSYFHNDGIPYINVGLNDCGGGYMMANYLIGEGHRNIAFLADVKTPIGVDYERLKGCKAAMAEHKLHFGDEDYVYISHRFQERHDTLRAFIRTRLKNYTALFFASDYYAVDAINLLHDEGISVPGDISVCGFDDNIFAIQCRPQLTTIRQDVSRKAAYATEQVLRCIRKENIDPKIIRLTVSLQVRDSVARI